VLLNLHYLFFSFQGLTIFAYEKGLFGYDTLANYSKNVIKSESSGGFFWKLQYFQCKGTGGDSIS
jgi:hypothetical protein